MTFISGKCVTIYKEFIRHHSRSIGPESIAFTAKLVTKETFVALVVDSLSPAKNAENPDFANIFGAKTELVEFTWIVCNDSCERKKFEFFICSMTLSLSTPDETNSGFSKLVLIRICWLSYYSTNHEKLFSTISELWSGKCCKDKTSLFIWFISAGICIRCENWTSSSPSLFKYLMSKLGLSLASVWFTSA